MVDMIQVSQVSKAFGEKTALSQISFTVEEGTIFGFLGPSGSGKTTLIKILTGQLAADSGLTKILGKDSRQLEPEDFEQMGLLSDESGFFEKMTLEQNLSFYARLYGVGREVVDRLLESVGLADSKKVLAEKLSTGMKQRMLLVRALINTPRLLFLDEPTSGLDPTTSRKIHELLLILKAQGTTIFLTTHDMVEATLLCDQLVLLNQGNLVEQGSPKAIISKYNTDKRVRIAFADQRERELLFSELVKLDCSQVVTIHSCEPTLEEIFIKRTGDKLNV